MVSSAWKNIDAEEDDGVDGYEDKAGTACCPDYSSFKENRARGNWPYGIQGSLALVGGLLGSSVIMNSVPYCIRLYGLEFLIPYTLSLFLLSMPLFYLEITTGQFTSRGLLSCWMLPAFKAIGVFMLFVNIPHAVLQGTNAARGLYELHEGVKSSLGYNVTDEPMTNEGTFNGTLAAALLIVWILVAVISCFGIRAIAWVSTVMVPIYLILMIILAAMVNHLVGPETMWNRWRSTDDYFNLDSTFASEATFAALTAGLATTGIVIVYGSYNRFHNDVIKDTAVVFIFKYFVDILLAVIFVGLSSYDAEEKHTRDEKMLQVKEYDWSYNTLSDVFEKMTGGSSYAIAYFMMFFFMALLHVMAILETFVTSLLDVLPRYRWMRPVVVLVTSTVLYLLSFTLCTVDDRYWEMLLWRNVVIWAIHLIPLLMVGAFLIYGIQTYFRHRHDMAAMTRWNLWCIPSVVPWWSATALLLTLIPWTVLASVGAVARGYISSDRPDWSNKHVERALSALYVLIIPVVFFTQLVLAVLWKSPHSWKTMMGAVPSWNPALGKHTVRADRYRRMNPYSTQNYADPAPKDVSVQRPLQSFYV